MTFVTNVLHKAEVKVPVLLVTLVYIDRAKPHLQIALEQWACERVFLGALILANKVRLISDLALGYSDQTDTSISRSTATTRP